MKEGRPSDVVELSDSLIFLLELVHRLIDISYLAASRTLWIAQQIQIDMPDSQEDLNEEVRKMRESLIRLSDFLEGVPYVPPPSGPGQAHSGVVIQIKKS
ncbi:MAG: hypothetical protein OXC80_03700 [Gammaproteobacteria bacterium]|nr:hypothetical protein [Gammaproteobacteria bacterium]